MTRFAVLLLCLLIFGPFAAGQTTIYVDCTNPSCLGADGSPGNPFCTVQEGVNAAVNGDTVLVHPCTYIENIDFLGKAITLKSSGGAAVTVIDGNQAGSVVSFRSGEAANSVLDGFTITNGRTTGSASGGGIFCSQSSPTIRNTTVTANTANALGGGIYCLYSSPTISNTTVSANNAYGGGGIYCIVSSPKITNSVVIANTARWNSGGGISLASSPSTPATIITNTTVTGNTANRHGGGIFCYRSSPMIANTVVRGNHGSFGGGISCVAASPTIANVTLTANRGVLGAGLYAITGYFSGIPSHPIVTNTIAWGDSGVEVLSDASSSITATYSDIQGGYPGMGNIDADPLFVDPINGDLRLDCGSSCVDAGINAPGVPLPPFDHSGQDLRTIGATIDIGADEAGTFWDFNAPPSAPWAGQQANFTARGTSGQSGNLSQVYISLGDGSPSSGLRVPLAGGRRLRLDPDGILGLWVSLPTVLRQVNLNGCGGVSTTLVTLPTIPIAVTVYFSGVTWDVGTGVVTSISETQAFVTQ